MANPAEVHRSRWVVGRRAGSCRSEETASQSKSDCQAGSSWAWQIHKHKPQAWGPSAGSRKSSSFESTVHTGLLISGNVHDFGRAAVAQLGRKIDELQSTHCLPAQHTGQQSSSVHFLASGLLAACWPSKPLSQSPGSFAWPSSGTRGKAWEETIAIYLAFAEQKHWVKGCMRNEPNHSGTSWTFTSFQLCELVFLQCFLAE